MRNWKFLLFLVACIGIATVGVLQAKVTLLPDYIRTNPFKNRVNERSANKYEVLCETFGGITADAAVEGGLTCEKVFSPQPGLTCYKNCSCDKAKFKYTHANCSGEGKSLQGKSCDSGYEECICDTAIFPYKQGDPSCEGTLEGLCVGSNGTFAKICNDPCAGLVEANCLIGGVDYGCAQEYGSGCTLCKTCNADTCNLSDNASKPLVTECATCSTKVSGCASKCEPSACGECPNCAGYPFDIRAIPNALTIDICTLCGGLPKYKAKTCAEGFTLDTTTGGCKALDCDAYMAAKGYVVVSNAAQFKAAAAAMPGEKPILLTNDVTFGDGSGTNIGVANNIYTYAAAHKIFAGCDASKAAKIILNNETQMRFDGARLEIYPHISQPGDAVIQITTPTTFYGGADFSALNVQGNVDVVFAGAKDYSYTYGLYYGLSGPGTSKITLGPGARLIEDATIGNASLKTLWLDVGSCFEQKLFGVNSYLVCAETPTEIIMDGAGSPTATACSEAGVSENGMTCKGTIYSNCSIGSVSVPGSVTPTICPITANTISAAPTSNGPTSEGYEPWNKTYSEVRCARCETMDSCDSNATICAQQAENAFRSCYLNNNNAEKDMGDRATDCMKQVMSKKQACETVRMSCKGPGACAKMNAAGKADVAVVSSLADLKKAVGTSSLNTIIVDADITLDSALGWGAMSATKTRTLIGSTDPSIGCPCDSALGDCTNGKYKIITGAGGTPETRGSGSLVTTFGSTLKNLEVFSISQNPNDVALTSAYATLDMANIVLEDVIIDGGVGYGIKSGVPTWYEFRGDNQIFAMTAINNTSVKLASGATLSTRGQSGLTDIGTLILEPGDENGGRDTKLKICATYEGLVVKKAVAGPVPHAYIDIRGGWRALGIEENTEEVTWPYNTRIKVTDGYGVYALVPNLIISGDLDIVSEAPETEGIYVSGLLTFDTQTNEKSGIGIVRVITDSLKPAIYAEKSINVRTYLHVENKGTGDGNGEYFGEYASAGIVARNGITFKEPGCLSRYETPNVCDSVPDYTAEISGGGIGIGANTIFTVAEGSNVLAKAMGAPVYLDAPSIVAIVGGLTAEIIPGGGRFFPGAIECGAKHTGRFGVGGVLTTKGGYATGGIKDCGLVEINGGFMDVDNRVVFLSEKIMGGVVGEFSNNATLNLNASVDQIVAHALYSVDSEVYMDSSTTLRAFYGSSDEGLYNLADITYVRRPNNQENYYMLDTAYYCGSSPCSIYPVSIDAMVSDMGDPPRIGDFRTRGNVRLTAGCSNFVDDGVCPLSAREKSYQVECNETQMSRCYGVPSSYYPSQTNNISLGSSQNLYYFDEEPICPADPSEYKYSCSGVGFARGDGNSYLGYYKACKCADGYDWSGGTCVVGCQSAYKYTCGGSSQKAPAGYAACKGKYPLCDCTSSSYEWSSSSESCGSVAQTSSCIVGGGAVVSEDFPCNSLIGGPLAGGKKCCADGGLSSCSGSYMYSCAGYAYGGGSGTSCNGLYQSCTCSTGHSWSSGACKLPSCASSYKYNCTGINQVLPTSAACGGLYQSCSCRSGYSWNASAGTCEIGCDAIIFKYPCVGPKETTPDDPSACCSGACRECGCEGGYSWNASTGVCEFTGECPDGFIWSDSVIGCVSKCPEGFVWDAARDRCVPMLPD